MTSPRKKEQMGFTLLDVILSFVWRLMVTSPFVFYCQPMRKNFKLKSWTSNMKKMICDSSDRQNINPRPWKCWVDGTYHIIITSHVILLTLPSGAIETKQAWLTSDSRPAPPGRPSQLPPRGCPELQSRPRHSRHRHERRPPTPAPPPQQWGGPGSGPDWTCEPGWWGWGCPLWGGCCEPQWRRSPRMCRPPPPSDASPGRDTSSPSCPPSRGSCGTGPSPSPPYFLSQNFSSSSAPSPHWGMPGDLSLGSLSRLRLLCLSLWLWSDPCLDWGWTWHLWFCWDSSAVWLLTAVCSTLSSPRASSVFPPEMINVSLREPEVSWKIFSTSNIWKLFLSHDCLIRSAAIEKYNNAKDKQNGDQPCPSFSTTLVHCVAPLSFV